MITVNIIGAGNVATHLYKAFNKSNQVAINQWFSRDLKCVQDFDSETDITNDLSTLEPTDVTIIAVSDDAIAEVSKHIPYENTLVVHTSGSVSLHELDKKHRRGVFYPLQSFSKTAEIDFSNVPICVEIDRLADVPILKKLVTVIGSPYYRINSDQRATLHLAAVFVNNFSNQLYRIAHEITESTSVEFEILKPLIMETAHKIESISPYMAQTGPAIRKDKRTIKKHLNALKNPIHKDIYQLLTKSIQKTHGR